MSFLLMVFLEDSINYISYSKIEEENIAIVHIINTSIKIMDDITLSLTAMTVHFPPRNLVYRYPI